MTAVSRTLVGVGVVGAGAMGAAHVSTLAHSVGGCHVASVYDTDLARAREVAGPVGALAADSADQLITSPQVDAVIIAAPEQMHEQLVLSCLAVGKPVLCEKPLSTGPGGSLRIVEAEIAGGRQLLQVGFMRRFDPAYTQLRELVQAGGVGTPRVVHCVHRNARAHPSATSDSVVTGSMIHELDMVPWLLGEPMVAITVFAPPVLDGRLLDPQVAVVEMVGGALVTIEVFVNARYGYDVRCEVVGETGSARLTAPYGLSLRRAGSDAAAVSENFVQRFGDAYRLELGSWVCDVRAGLVNGADAWDGHLANLAAEAGVTSLHGGIRVPITVAAVPELYRRADRADR